MYIKVIQKLILSLTVKLNFSEHAILVPKKLQKEKVVVEHVPDALAAELFTLLKDKIVIMKFCLTGESVQAREWTWNKELGIRNLESQFHAITNGQYWHKKETRKET